jgi:hypothetical protein
VRRSTTAPPGFFERTSREPYGVPLGRRGVLSEKHRAPRDLVRRIDPREARRRQDVAARRTEPSVTLRPIARRAPSLIPRPAGLGARRGVRRRSSSPRGAPLGVPADRLGGRGSAAFIDKSRHPWRPSRFREHHAAPNLSAETTPPRRGTATTQPQPRLAVAPPSPRSGIKAGARARRPKAENAGRAMRHAAGAATRDRPRLTARAG